MSAVAPEALAAARAYLRIETADEDAVLSEMIGAAMAMGERFTGQVLLTRTLTEIVPVRREWTRLAATPVRAVTGVEGLPAEGAAFALPVGAYAIDIDAGGDGWVRVPQPGAAGRVRVTLSAGMASEWGTLPEPIRHGILRLSAHLFDARGRAAQSGNDRGDGGVPAAVTALWRPWRRMRLG